MDAQQLVTLDDWESGKVKLTDEWFDPIYLGSFDARGKLVSKTLAYFYGRETGTALEPALQEVLEDR